MATKMVQNGVPYTGCDVRIIASINGKTTTVIDEVNYFKYNVQQDIIPLYSYNSALFNNIAQSKKLVTGAFSINFIFPNYLGSVFGSSTNTVVTPDPNATSRFDVLKSLRDRISAGEDPIILKEAEDALNNLLKAQENLDILDSQFDHETIRFVVTFDPGTYSTVPDIYKPTNSAHRYIIDNVYITSFGQEFQPSGEPLQEVYTFLARSVA